MFEQKAAMFVYATSPVHMGAGSAIGVIDSPIQRERHTGHPVLAGSGLKGALRHEAVNLWSNNTGLINAVFGPEPSSNGSTSDHAGAGAFSDAQIVLFPVRSLRSSYVYATCPTAIARLHRLLEAAGIHLPWKVPSLLEERCGVTSPDLLVKDKLILETFELTKDEAPGVALQPIAAWLAANVIPDGPGHEYFRAKIARHTVLLSDERFGWFAKNATLVEPHVKIDDASGTAQDGGLFYIESLPPESVLVSLCMASRERSKENRRSAADVLSAISRGGGELVGFSGRSLQIGGDATTGRGQVVLSFVHAEGGKR